MILPLSAIWTSRNICQKTVVFNMDSDSFISWTVEEGFFNIIAINDITSSNLDVAYYDSIANAEAGTATGRLALGQTAVNNYLSATGWASGQAIRIFNTLGATLQAGEIVYKATPSIDVPCGVQLTPYIAGNAKVYDGTFDYDTVNSWTEVNKGQAWTINIQALIDSLASNITFLNQGLISVTFPPYINNRGLAISVRTDGLISINMSNSNTNRIIVRFSAVEVGYNSIFITYDGSGSAAGFTARANGNDLTRAIVQNTLTGSILQSTLKTVIIGASPENNSFRNYVDGLIKKMQWLDTDYSGTQALLDAEQVGSFEGIVDDARFLLDPDFNQTGITDLTTRSGTPTYTITASGGAAYTKYVP